MRGAMAGDVAAERRLDVIKDLLEVLPRSRGFRVHADGSVSVYLASSRARLPAAKQKSYPRPPERVPRSEQAGGKRAANARTRRSYSWRITGNWKTATVITVITAVITLQL